jgi:hypothetical protein
MALNYVNGPANGVSTDNALVRWDGTTGRLVQNSGVQVSDADMVSVPSTVGSGMELYGVGGVGVADYERLRLTYDTSGGGRYLFNAEAGGSGTVRPIRFVSGVGLLSVSSTAVAVQTAGGASGATPFSIVPGTLTSTSAGQLAASIGGTVNQASGTGGYTALLINPTLTAVGSAGANFLVMQENGTTRARFDANGRLLLNSQTAPQPGGTRMIGMMSAVVGIFVGSGAPTASGAQGSLYLRTDGTGINDRAYINTDGGTTWTALVTVA